MSKRITPTWAEQLDVMRLLADVAALKHDPAAQQHHLIDALNAKFRTRVGWFFVFDDFVPDKTPVMRHQVLTSDPDPEFIRSLTGLGVDIPMEAEPFADHALQDSSALQLWTRKQVFSHPDAGKRYAPTTALYDAGKVTDGMVGLFRDGLQRERIVGVALHRMYRERHLSPREQSLLRFLLQELQGLVRRGHVLLADPSRPNLPPRLQQVLDRLLRGMGVKHIARELDLSVWTVREHVQRLYRRYDVHGRDELMARFVKPPGGK